jgi:phosphofructokinase-like protein
MRKTIGILTGGGDCPGLNAVIRAIVRRSILFYGYEIIGILEGWKGMLEVKTIPLDLDKVSGILQRGGTMLKTSRTNPAKRERGLERVMENFKDLGLHALIAAGGEDTLSVASQLHKEGLNVVGVPKTIDNDLYGTDYTFGFDTAINTAMQAIDRVHSTAESHNRVMVVEVMGRNTGWIAVESGIAGGADVILIPEKPIDVDRVCDLIKKRHKRGRDFSIVVVAEGAKFSEKHEEEGKLILQDRMVDEFGHVHLGGIGSVLAKAIEKRTGYETRVVILGHIQRGGSPTAFDRVLGTRFGVKAADLVHQGDFGKMVSLQGNRMVAVPLEEATAQIKTVDQDLYEIAEAFFG